MALSPVSSGETARTRRLLYPLRPWSRQRAAVVAALLALSVGLAAAFAISRGAGRPRGSALAGVATAAVAHRDLVQHDAVTGTLDYTDPRNVVNSLSGTLTWLPDPGAVVDPGQPLYRVDGHAIFLFDGETPAARAFEPGMTAGADVLELKRALRALGFDPAHQLIMNGSFDWATRAVIERWQQANGMPLTGTVPLGQVVFQPGPRRVGQLQLTTGTSITPGQVPFQTSSSERIVTGSVDASQQSDLAIGEPVSVDLLNGTVTRGRIVEIDKVATTSSSQNQQQGSQGGNGNSSTSSTLGFQVRLANPRIAGDLDQAPVNIDVVSSKATNVLSVPVTALLAQQGGGYAVQVVRAGTITIVPVAPGFYSDDGFVQISSPRIRAGERVVVPQ